MGVGAELKNAHVRKAEKEFRTNDAGEPWTGEYNWLGPLFLLLICSEMSGLICCFSCPALLNSGLIEEKNGQVSGVDVASVPCMSLTLQFCYNGTSGSSCIEAGEWKEGPKESHSLGSSWISFGSSALCGSMLDSVPFSQDVGGLCHWGSPTPGPQLGAFLPQSTPPLCCDHLALQSSLLASIQEDPSVAPIHDVQIWFTGKNYDPHSGIFWHGCVHCRQIFQPVFWHVGTERLKC